MTTRNSSSMEMAMETEYLPYYPIVVMSCVFFLIIFKYVSPVLSAWISVGYLSLSQYKKIDWDLRSVFQQV